MVHCGSEGGEINDVTKMVLHAPILTKQINLLFEHLNDGLTV